MVDRAFVSVSLVATIFLIVLINLTTPSDVGPLGVLVFFTLIYAVCLGVATMGCRLLLGLKQKMQKKGMGGVARKSRYYGSIIAFLPVMLIFVGSSGGIGLLEVGLIVFFGVIGCFYMSKRM